MTVAVMAAGAVLYAGAHSVCTAQGRGRTPAMPPQRLSGAERSLVVLQDISATLKRIDERLARMEANEERLGR